MMSSRSIGVMKSVATVLKMGVVDLVALVLQLVRALHDLFEMLRLGEAFDGLDQQLGFLNGNFRLFSNASK